MGNRNALLLLVLVVVLLLLLTNNYVEANSRKVITRTALERGVLTQEFVSIVKESYASQLETRTEDEVKEFAALLQEAILLAEEKEDTLRPLVYFNCSAYGPSSTKPTSVNALRPGDIEVVTALGDSITAAFGALASSIFTVTTQYVTQQCFVFLL